MKRKRIILSLLVFISLSQNNLLFCQDKKTKPSWDGNLATPVHQIPLKDEFDLTIIPTEKYPLPFSSKFTCAPCHDYTKIRKGLHFSANSKTRQGRIGEPWIWLDQKTGTILPLSYKDWKGVWDPQELGLTPWEFTLLFGRHMLGGGVNEPEVDDVGPESRWNVSGKIEVNCLGCHNVSRIQSHSEWAKQILRQNFRWAATASSGLGEVYGMASLLPNTWDIYDGPNPDDTEWAAAPSIRYNPLNFNSKFKVFFDISYKPNNSRCLTCHSVSSVQKKRFITEEDVHIGAGLKCVDCHRNDLSHNMVRGYEGEAEEFLEMDIAEFTCKGCHLGKDEKKGIGDGVGRLGAPYPKHRRIPPVHFARLACTVCHAGPYPNREITRVRTSRANRLGIYGVAQWHTDLPQIVEPVFVKDEFGKISPHRLLWPAFWGKLEGEKVIPLKPNDILEKAGGILDSEENVANLLIALSMDPEIGGIPVLVAFAKVYELNADRGLSVSSYSGQEIEETEADILWALKIKGKITSLIPDFDPDSEELDVDVETRIQIILDSLGNVPKTPGKPVLIYKKAVYQMIEGYLEKKEWEREISEYLRLGWWNENRFQPLISEFHLRTVVEIIGMEQTLTEEQVEIMLKSLGNSFIYISSGKMFKINEKGELVTTSHPAAEPVVWPLGHQVRPVRQSLGIKGCKDCHSARSAFFFTKVEGVGPLKTEKNAVRSNVSLMGLDKPYQKLFGLSFTIRPLLKIVLFVSAFFIASFLLLMFLLTLGRYSGLIEKRR